MSAARFHQGHLFHLIQHSNASSEEKKSLRLNLEGGSMRAKEEVVARLEELLPGTRERLSKLWTAYGRTSLYLWQTTALVPFSTAQVKAMVAKAVAKTEPGFRAAQLTGKWHRLVHHEGRQLPVTADSDNSETQSGEDASPVKARVLRVRFEGTEFSSTVRLVKSHSYIFEDEERVYRMTYDVGINIDLDSEGRLARVFGAQHDGRTSMRTLLEWILGGELPPRMPALGEYMLPVAFTERQVQRLAGSYQMPCVGMEGSDAKSVVGKIGLEGKLKGYELAALDLADERVKAQNAVRQDSRTYNFSFKHSEDSFKESSRVTFHFGHRQQHVGFPVRTSQPAMEYIVGALYDEVRRGP